MLYSSRFNTELLEKQARHGEKWPVVNHSHVKPFVNLLQLENQRVAYCIALYLDLFQKKWEIMIAALVLKVSRRNVNNRGINVG